MTQRAALAPRRKLIEVSLPLEAINRAAAREKSIRHGHPSTLHLWWARRPLAACRAVLFAQLVDDPSAWPERFPSPAAQDAERRRLHLLIEDMVAWEASNDDRILDAARFEIARSVAWGLGEEPPAKGQGKGDGKAILAYLQAKAPPVHDPFSGGGSIPLEAQRLGLRAYGADLNPVAVLIGKALVEIPPMFAAQAPVNPAAQAQVRRGGVWNGRGAEGLAEDVRHYGGWMRDEAARRIGHLYPQAVLADGAPATIIAWLWARTVRSPDPAAKGAMVPLVSSFLLSSKAGRQDGRQARQKVWVEPVIEASAPQGWRFQVKAGPLTEEDEARLKRGTKTGRGANFYCLLTGAALAPAHIRGEFRAGRAGERLLAIVAEGERGRLYLSPDAWQEEIARSARPAWKPDTAMEQRSSNLISGRGYGFTSWHEIFTPRQLVALTTFCDLVAEARLQALAHARAAGLPDDGVPLNGGGTGAEAYADAVATYLAFAVSKSTTRSCALAIWETGMGRLAGALGRQALPMQWVFAETNPLAGAGGDLAGAAVSVAENVQNLGLGPAGSISNLAAQSNALPQSPVMISTDPPYYDNIGYADLSDFFYVWLRHSLAGVWPDLFRRLTTPKDEELVATPFRHGGREAAEAFFMQGMGEALAAMRRAASDGEPLTIYYAFKQSEAGEDGATSAGWASFLQAIVDAGLTVDGTWPVRTEATNALKANVNALASSIVLVCRKRPADAGIIGRADFVAALKRELPPAIEAIRKAGVGPVDMQQAIIGPGMGVFTRHAEVLEDDDRVIPVKTALSIINRAWEEIDDELVAAFDPETQVALAWFGSYGFEAQASGELITLATAKNTSDRSLFASGVFRNLHGKASLTRRRDLPRNWLPSPDKGFTVWEAVQHLVRALHAEDGGAAAAAALLARMGAKAEAARALADRLFRLATDRGWAQEALAYNHLAEEWPDLLDRAAEIDAGRHQVEAGDLFAPA